MNAYYVALLGRMLHVSQTSPGNLFQTPRNIYFRPFLKCVTLLCVRFPAFTFL